MIIGGALGTIVQAAWAEKTVLCFAFWLATACCIACYLRTIYFLVRSYHGHVYRFLPFALEIRSYRDDLRHWYATYGGGSDEAEKEFEEYLERLNAEAADHNARINLEKSEYLFRANTWLVYCVILTVAAFVPFTAHRVWP